MDEEAEGRLFPDGRQIALLVSVVKVDTGRGGGVRFEDACWLVCTDQTLKVRRWKSCYKPDVQQLVFFRRCEMFCSIVYFSPLVLTFWTRHADRHRAGRNDKEMLATKKKTEGMNIETQSTDQEVPRGGWRMLRGEQTGCSAGVGGERRWGGGSKDKNDKGKADCCLCVCDSALVFVCVTQRDNRARRRPRIHRRTPHSSLGYL